MITYSIRKTVFLFATTCMLGAAGFGCGGNVVVDHGEGASGPGGGGDGGAGAGAGTSTATAGGSTSSSTSAPSIYGTPDAACLIKAGSTVACEQLFNAGGKSDSKLTKECKGKSFGTLVPACPSAGVIGCCAISIPESGGIAEECVYSNETQKEFKMSCEASHAMFSTSP